MGCIFFTYFGDMVRRFWLRLKQKRQAAKQHTVENQSVPQHIAEPKPRKFINRIWDRYGLVGVSILTPPLFSPPIGCTICVAFGAPKGKVIRAMTISMIVWALVFATLGQGILELFGLN